MCIPQSNIIRLPLIVTTTQLFPTSCPAPSLFKTNNYLCKYINIGLVRIFCFKRNTEDEAFDSHGFYSNPTVPLFPLLPSSCAFIFHPPAPGTNLNKEFFSSGRRVFFFFFFLFFSGALCFDGWPKGWNKCVQGPRPGTSKGPR